MSRVNRQDRHTWRHLLPKCCQNHQRVIGLIRGRTARLMCKPSSQVDEFKGLLPLRVVPTLILLQLQITARRATAMLSRAVLRAPTTESQATTVGGKRRSLPCSPIVRKHRKECTFRPVDRTRDSVLQKQLRLRRRDNYSIEFTSHRLSRQGRSKLSLNRAAYPTPQVDPEAWRAVLASPLQVHIRRVRRTGLGPAER